MAPNLVNKIQCDTQIYATLTHTPYEHHVEVYSPRARVEFEDKLMKSVADVVAKTVKMLTAIVFLRLASEQSDFMTVLRTR